MNDQDLERLLKSLNPRKAPSSMDGAVLRASEEALPRRGFRIYLLAAAAAVAAVAMTLFFIFNTPEPEKMEDKLLAEAKPAPSEEALEAKALLLELKLARLRKETYYFEDWDRYNSILDMLDSRLKVLDRPRTHDTESKEEKKNETPSDKGGTRNEEGHFPIYRNTDFPLGSPTLPG